MSEPLCVLLTNDDGIAASGINALADAFAQMEGVQTVLVAPDRERSTCSHGMSLSRPVYVTEMGENRYAVDGLPVDCVYIAAYGLLPAPPDIVVSGINHGANLGSDVIFSGTVAAARQAALQGVPGVASSLTSGADFGAAARVTAAIAIDVARRFRQEPVVLNLNFPGGAFQGPELAPLGRRKYPRVTSKRTAPLTGQHYYWLGGPAVEDGSAEGSDGWLVERGVATATFLRIDQTDETVLRARGEDARFERILQRISKDQK